MMWSKPSRRGWILILLLACLSGMLLPHCAQAASCAEPRLRFWNAALGDTLRMLPYNASAMPRAAARGIARKGPAVAGAHFTDAQGEFWVLVHERTVGEISSKGFRSGVQVHGYRMQATRAKRVWKVLQPGIGISTSSEYEPNTLKITDIDGNGAAECLFVLEQSPDGADPATVALYLIVNNEVASLVGQFAGEDEAIGIEKDVVEQLAFAGLDPALKSYARSAWATFAATYYH
jgi:hypothetical protein